MVDKYSLFAIRDYFLFLFFFFFSWFLGFLGGVAYDTGLVGDQFFQPRLFFGSGGGGGLFQRRFGPASPSLFSLKTKSFLSLVSMLYPFSMDSTSADLRFSSLDLSRPEIVWYLARRSMAFASTREFLGIFIPAIISSIPPMPPPPSPPY
jgi:hypothetical protein